MIGVCLAFPILVAATRNIITGALASLSMVCSTTCVIGVITLGGWKLGVSSSYLTNLIMGQHTRFWEFMAYAQAYSLLTLCILMDSSFWFDTINLG